MDVPWMTGSLSSQISVAMFVIKTQDTDITHKIVLCILVGPSRAIAFYRHW